MVKKARSVGTRVMADCPPASGWLQKTLSPPDFPLWMSACAVAASAVFVLLPLVLQQFLISFVSVLLVLVVLRRLLQDRRNQSQHVSLLETVETLLNTSEQQILLTLPVTASGHVLTATYLGGLLSQFGRDSVVVDMDLCHRMLSRKVIADPHKEGVYEHLLSPDLKKPYLDPLSGARVIPLETVIEADKLVELSQVVQRLPRLWERWPHAVIILDASQWHEAYHPVLAAVSQVIFYVPPGHRSQWLLPKIFENRYRKHVTLVTIQPDI